MKQKNDFDNFVRFLTLQLHQFQDSTQILELQKQHHGIANIGLNMPLQPKHVPPIAHFKMEKMKFGQWTWNLYYENGNARLPYRNGTVLTRGRKMETKNMITKLLLHSYVCSSLMFMNNWKKM